MSDEPCPRERENPSPDISACSDDELLLKFVELRSLVGQAADGRLYLTPTAIKQEDLKGGRRSVSTLRCPLTPKEEFVKRGLQINKEPAWADDPLAALTSVASIRSIKDKDNRREICVFAEPTTAEEDRLGACKTHAGLKRSNKPPVEKSRLEWAVLRGAVANQFSTFVHICSEIDVTSGYQK